MSVTPRQPRIRELANRAWQCAHWLNGVGRGSRYDGSFSGSSPVGSCATRMRGSVSQLTPAERQNTRK